jgi:hypothetical protein
MLLISVNTDAIVCGPAGNQADIGKMKLHFWPSGREASSFRATLLPIAMHLQGGAEPAVNLSRFSPSKSTFSLASKNVRICSRLSLNCLPHADLQSSVCPPFLSSFGVKNKPPAQAHLVLEER